MVTIDDPTELSLSGMGVPPYSARGLVQTLEPIGQAADLQRTINGTLVDLSDENFRKYMSTISGSDQRPPACDGVWPGQLVTVGCIAELCVAGQHEETTEGVTESALGRDYVPGSVYVEGNFTFYRPLLTMRVTGFNLNHDEWGRQVNWSLTLEEV